MFDDCQGRKLMPLGQAILQRASWRQSWIRGKVPTQKPTCRRYLRPSFPEADQSWPGQVHRQAECERSAILGYLIPLDPRSYPPTRTIAFLLSVSTWADVTMLNPPVAKCQVVWKAKGQSNRKVLTIHRIVVFQIEGKQLWVQAHWDSISGNEHSCGLNHPKYW